MATRRKSTTTETEDAAAAAASNGSSTDQGSEQPPVKTEDEKAAEAAAAASGTAPQQPKPEETPLTTAEASKPATTDENLVSTTRADDPNRDSTMPAATTAETIEGVQQQPNSNDTGAASIEGAAAFGSLTDPTRGNRHSHPAETMAERTTRIYEANQFTGPGPELLAGESADPANQPTVEPAKQESWQDESGALQDATRAGIGAGMGAVDGVADVGIDPSEVDVNKLIDDENDTATGGRKVDLGNGQIIEGNNAKLYRALEKGITHQQMLDLTGYRSCLGTAKHIADLSGRALGSEDVDGETVYKLAPKQKAG